MKRSFLLLTLLTTAACGRSPEPPAVPAAAEQVITGRERIGWDQRAEAIGALGWALYVDGTRFVVGDADCSATPAPDLFSCSGGIPAMAPGTHTLEIASFFAGAPEVESARSGALRVIMSAPTARSAPDDWDGMAIAARDGLRARVERVLDGLQDPVAAAIAPDGRLFIGEQPDIVTIYREKGRPPDRTRLDGVDGRSRGILALALDPAFERTSFVFVVHTVRLADGGAGIRLSRFREAGGTLGERAVLLDRVPASSARPAAAMRFAPDGRLWLALDAGDDPGSPEHPGRLNGKVLRLNPDGTTPSDQAASPVVMSGARSPRGLAFARGGVLWWSDAAIDGTAVLTAAAIGGRPVRAAVTGRYRMDTAAASALIAPAVAPWGADLLMASEAGRFLMRIRLDPNDSTRARDREVLLDERFGAIQAVAAGPDGSLYLCTRDALARLVPE
jgi:glucose/arabinose dehydrogenase